MRHTRSPLCLSSVYGVDLACVPSHVTHNKCVSPSALAVCAVPQPGAWGFTGAPAGRPGTGGGRDGERRIREKRSDAYTVGRRDYIPLPDRNLRTFIESQILDRS